MLFYQSEHLPGLWIDAFVVDEMQKLLFFSAWGNESYVQHLRARLSLAGNDIRQLRSFTLRGRKEQIIVGETDRLASVTGRPVNSPFFNLMHVWVFHDLVVEPDIGCLQALLIARHAETDETLYARIWQVVMRLSPVPLLPEWISLLKAFFERGFIKKHQGHQVDAYSISLDELSLSQFIQEKLKMHALPLPE